MRVLACPGCGVKIKIPEGKSGRCNCPKCGKALLIKAPGDPASTAAGQAMPSANQPQQRTPAPQSDPLQLPPTQPLPSQTLASSYPVPPSGGSYAALGRPTMPGAKKRPAAKGLTPELKGFLRRLGIGLGILSGVLLLVGALGLISEPIALAACFIGIVAATGLAVSGRLWMLIMAFQESVAQGLMVLLIPYYWIVYGAIRKGLALRPLALMFSALVPLLICLGMLAVFLPRYQGGMRIPFPGSRSSGPSAADLAKLQEQIRESRSTSPDADVLRTVSFPSYSQVGGAVDLAKAEQALAELPGYVLGSFRYDAQGRIVAFQYHGAEDVAPKYGLFVAVKANVRMSFTPTFGDEAMLPKESTVSATRPVVGSAIPAATPPAPAINISEAVANASNKLRTVSFQTFAQGPVNQAAAEQALAQVKGYFAGSFRFDEQQQLVTLQYRGPESAATQFGFALQQKLQMMVRMKPMFAEEP